MQKEVGIIEAKFQRRWDVYMCSCSLCIGFKDQRRLPYALQKEKVGEN